MPAKRDVFWGQDHTVAGAWMHEKFGLNYRSYALFCTGDREVASRYASLPACALISIEPIGEYSLCYSEKCMDLYGHFLFMPQLSDDAIRESLEDLNFKEFRNSGIDPAAESGCEVMLFANKFAYARLT